MLYIVLFLVVAALAGVVAALITANSLWAWISIGLSVLAGLLLLVDWFRRRPGGTAAASEPARTDASETDADSADSDTAEPASETVESESESESESETVGADASEADATGTAQSAPGEEDTDAADALIVSSLEEEVLVVDEYPRYHLSECGWLADRETIPIAVSEARDLGFSPCVRCTPDASLAGEHRKTRDKFRSGADG